MKTGRNDPCPCGSGKKLKKCCIKKKHLFKNNPQPQNKKVKKKKSYLYQFDKNERIKLFAALKSHPQNHGKNIRLEELMENSIESKSKSKNPLDVGDIRTYLSKKYSSHHLEDPPVNLFTEIITFHGGDYLVFSGIVEWGVFILRNMLNTLQNPSLVVPPDFKIVCESAALLLLKISDATAKKAGLKRYEKVELLDYLIHIPTQNKLDTYINAVTFNKSELEEMANSVGLDLKPLEPFICPENPKSHFNQHTGETILVNTPLYWIDDNSLVVISPCTIILALSRFIWDTADTFDCLDIFTEAYHDVLLEYSTYCLEGIGFSLKTPKSLPPIKVILPIKERFFFFDDDKIAYVTYHYNNRKKSTGKVSDRQKEVVEWLKKNSKVKDVQILNLNLIGITGELESLGLDNIDGSLFVMMQCPELELIFQSQKADRMTFWKFATAKFELSRLSGFMPDMIAMSDYYAIYKENDDSFYLSDDERPTALALMPGEFSSALVEEATQACDYHSILREIDGRLGWVPCVSQRILNGVYYPFGSRGEKIEQVVDVYNMPIWIEPSIDVLKDALVSMRGFYVQLNDGFCYWLNEIKNTASTKINLLGWKPITIKYELISPEKWEDITPSDLGAKSSNLEELFVLNYDKNTIHVQLPFELAAHLSGEDNEGERVLIRVILKALNEIAIHQGLEDLFSEDNINKIIDIHAPLGLKKKVFILNTGADLRLDPRGISRYRYIQSHDISFVLDNIISKTKKLPSISSSSSNKEKGQFTRAIVLGGLLPWLKEELKKYDSVELLKRLMSINDCMINQREKLRLETPLKIACFISQKERIKELQEELIKLDDTTLSVRCLIEHLAAERYSGTKTISTESVDLLLAIMSEIFKWGMMGDIVDFGLVDVELTLLPSGRVGTNFASIVSSKFKSYKESKIEEDVIDAEGYTKSVLGYIDNRPLDESEGIKILESVDNGFEDLYGITLTRFKELSYILVVVGLNWCEINRKGHVLIKKDELKTELEKVASEPISQPIFDSLINNFSLSDRGKVEKIPSGFTRNDISPWRYNRQLSLLRKPLVLIESEEKDNPFILYGARQVLVTFMLIQHRIREARLKVPEGTKLHKVIGRMANKKGADFVQKVYDYCNGLGCSIIEKELDLKPKSRFKTNKDLGDIDVFIIDESSKTIINLECKKMLAGKNIKEMVEEAEKLLNDDDGWVAKHEKRDTWLKNNKPVLSKEFSIDLTDYDVKSLFITSESLSSSFVKENELTLPFTTMYKLEEKGLDAFLNC